MNILGIISRPPYQDSHDLELIEVAMVAAVFDMNVSLLFRDAGIWALLDNQDASPLEQRTLSKVLTALPAYEVENIYVCADSMDKYALSGQQFCLPIIALSLIEQQQLIAQQHAVLGAQA